MIVWGGHQRRPISTLAEDTIPAPTVGLPPAPRTRPLADSPHSSLDRQRNDRLGRIARRFFNNGGRYCAPPVPPPTPPATDFNRDGKPDYVLYNASTRQTAIWYLNNNAYISGAFGPTLPTGQGLIDVADFNRDGKPDYVLFNTSTRQTAIRYLNNNVFVSSANGPTLPSGYQLAAVGDFNRDGKPDYVLFNASTRQTAIWYLNNNVFVSSAYGPTCCRLTDAAQRISMATANPITCSSTLTRQTSRSGI